MLQTTKDIKNSSNLCSKANNSNYVMVLKELQSNRNHTELGLENKGRD